MNKLVREINKEFNGDLILELEGDYIRITVGSKTIEVSFGGEIFSVQCKGEKKNEKSD